MSLSPVRDRKRHKTPTPPIYSSVSEEDNQHTQKQNSNKSYQHKHKKAHKEKKDKDKKDKDKGNKQHKSEKAQRSISRHHSPVSRENGEIKNNARAKANGGVLQDDARKGPLSLEDLLKKKQQQQVMESKPVFLTKKQRQDLQEKEEQDKEELKVKQQQLLHQQERQMGHQQQTQQQHGKENAEYDRVRRERDKERQLDRQMEDDRRRGGSGGGESYRGRYSEDMRGERSEHAREPERNGEEFVEEKERQRELELIKQQYLGQERTKRKIVKPSEKFRFNFDWDIADDTSRDLNPIYNRLHDPALLFGRGYFAGFDRKDQRRQQAIHEKELLEKIKEQNKDKKSKDKHQPHDRDRKDKGKDKKDKKETESKLLKSQYRDLDKFKEERHWTKKRLQDMTERDWRIFREDFNIAYKGHNPTMPLRNWEEGNFPEAIMKSIKDCNYKKPSPIQMAAIPLGLQQKDVIGIAETGSGKTAAFVIPMLSYIMNQPPMTHANEADGPYATVMAPTRELTQQIEEETIKLARHTPYRVSSVVGGQSIEEQGVKLRKGCEMVIATPGRLLDCLERRYAVLNQCNYIVLDEADKMIEMGFEQQVMGVLDAMPSTNLKPENELVELEKNRVYRTTYMFSATMPAPVERLARKYLRRPVIVIIGTVGRATDNVSQRVQMVKENEKHNRLMDELAYQSERKYIIFVNTRSQCDHVYKILSDEGYQCTVLHGGRTQDQREQSIKGFREDLYDILIATDVAGRGIDVPDVGLVINYDMPKNVEMYTHRIGRTGRAGKKGTAITFLTLHDTDVFYDLKKLLDDCNQPIPSELLRHEASKSKPGAFENKAKRDEIVYARN